MTILIAEFIFGLALLSYNERSSLDAQSTSGEHMKSFPTFRTSRRPQLESLESRIALTIDFAFHPLTNHDIDIPQSIVTADLDGDGDEDILVTEWNEGVRWLENSDGNFLPSKLVGIRLKVRIAIPADLDGDGDLDIIAGEDASWQWYANDGSGGFGVRQPLGVGGFRAAVVDIDKDGDLDVVSGTTFTGATGVLYVNENTDGKGSFKSKVVHNIVGRGDFFEVVAADLDADGDEDIIVTSRLVDGEKAGIVAWYENDGQGELSEQQIITEDLQQSRGLAAGDVDGDGDVDIVASSDTRPGEIVLFTNEGDRSFSESIVVADIDSNQQLWLEDLDEDGDLDLLGVFDGATDWASWFENDGSGKFSQIIITEEIRDPRYISYGDIDGDGDLDILSASRDDDFKLAWYESDLAPASSALADIDGDGVVAFADFLIMSRNFGAIDSVFADGDLDGDGEVAFADFLILSANFGRRAGAVTGPPNVLTFYWMR